MVDETKKFLTYSYNLNSDDTDLTGLLNDIKNEGLILKDIITEQSSLEEIFIKLIKENNELVRN